MTEVQTETGVLAGDERMLIDGELEYTSSGAKFDVIHPASEQVAGQAADGTVEDMERAVGAARRAFDTTDSSRDVEFRYHCLTQLHAALEKDKERLRRILITEVGCPVTVSGSQIESPIDEVKHWAEHGKNFDYLVDTGVHPTQLGPARRKIHYQPVGVVGAITPRNAPLYLNIAETVPALMAGNTVVLKPAQLTPWSGIEYGRIVAEETDIPPGVINVVVSNANEVGAALAADPRVDMITFTGSTATGRAILAAGASTVKKTLLELGGKSAHIVLDDADFNSALPMAAMMACVMSGQSCILPSRILLPRSRYEEGIETVKTMMEGFPVGDPWTPGNMQGPQNQRIAAAKGAWPDQGRHRFGCPAGHRWRRPGEPADRLLRAAHAARRRRHQLASRAGGDLRPGAGSHAVRQRRRSRRDRQQLHLRAVR